MTRQVRTATTGGAMGGEHDGSSGSDAAPEPAIPAGSEPPLPPEVGGRKGPEPTRFGDWERNGRCIDF